jgi:hypothetical protein
MDSFQQLRHQGTAGGLGSLDFTNARSYDHGNLSRQGPSRRETPPKPEPVLPPPDRSHPDLQGERFSQRNLRDVTTADSEFFKESQDDL